MNTALAAAGCIVILLGVFNVNSICAKYNYESYINKKLSEVRAYIMRFENGKSWNIPKDNYTWSGEHPMSDRTLYQSTHPRDLFLTVTKKDTGEIVMAYPTEYFEYKN